MEAAIAQLTMAGFDRAALSLPQTHVAAGQATPELGADAPLTDTDVRQARTMGTSMAGSIGALAAAGAVIATGGAAAVAAAAAAAIGAGAALTANAAGNAADKVQADDRTDRAAARAVGVVRRRAGCRTAGACDPHHARSRRDAGGGRGEDEWDDGCDRAARRRGFDRLDWLTDMQKQPLT